MTNTERQYIGKKLQWEQIIKLFPESYVALDEYKDEGDIITGIVMYVGKTKSEMMPVLKEWADKGNKLNCIYTAESMELNGLWEL